MFISTVDNLIEEMTKHAPELGRFKSLMLEAIGSVVEVEKVYAQLPKESIDYAVIEKSERVDVVASSFDWSDLGSWDALEEIVEKENNNTICSAESTQFMESEGNIIYAPGKKVSLVNCSDLVVVVDGEHVMVLPKQDSQKVKHLKQNL